MTHVIDGEEGHTHGCFVQKHLNQKRLDIIDSTIINSEEDIGNINPILLGQHRLKHEFRAARIRNGLSKSTSDDLFLEFSNIEDEFRGYIVSAELVSSKFCIMFSSPEMTMSKLRFESYPLITDVTYNAVCQGYYLYSTVIFVPVMKNTIIF